MIDNITYNTNGVCSRKIDIEIEDGIIVGVKFLGGPSDWGICYNGFKAEVEKYKKAGLFSFREYGK